MIFVRWWKLGISTVYTQQNQLLHKVLDFSSETTLELRDHQYVRT